MRSRAGRLLCVVVSLIHMLSSLASAQQGGRPGASPEDAAASSPTSLKSWGAPLSDYVPCLFNNDEQFDMRALEAPRKLAQRLDKRSAEQLLDATKVAVSQSFAKYSTQNPDFLANFYAEFGKLLPYELIGMTPDQANLRIQAMLVDAVNDAAKKAKDAGTPLSTAEQVSAANQVEGWVGNAAFDFLRDNLRKMKEEKKSDTEVWNAVIEQTQSAIRTADPKSNISAAYRNAVLDAYRPGNPPDYPSDWPSTLAQSAKAAAKRVQVSPTSQIQGIDIESAETSVRAALGASAAQAIKEAEARSQPREFQPPDDVSCTMAIMSWKETSDIFGRRVANTYVAIQVTLRNLNGKNEFLVHDVQVAIDTGVSADFFGRFQAGRDKLLVRSVAQRGQSEDRRNLVLHTLQAAGAIAGAASIATGVGAAQEAVVVFQGAFIPGFANIFPDHTVEQLNHINDLVFSASSTSKVLVPIQGSIPLVTFIAEKPIEQLPFAWCGHPPSGQMKRWLGHNPEQLCEFGRNGSTGSLQKDKFGSTKSPKNTSAAYEVNSSSEAVGATSSGGANQNSGYAGPYTYNKRGQIDIGPDDDKPWNDLHYKNWYGAALRMLQERTLL